MTTDASPSISFTLVVVLDILTLVLIPLLVPCVDYIHFVRVESLSANWLRFIRIGGGLEDPEGGKGFGGLRGCVDGGGGRGVMGRRTLG